MKKVHEGDDDQMNHHYKIINNKLYRKCKGNWKLYIPKEFQTELIEEIYQIYRHTGTKKTVQLIKEYFTMDSMCKTISHVIKYCDICQKCKDSGTRFITGETRPIVPRHKGELINMDYYGPLPVSSGGMKYLLVMVDNFTKDLLSDML